MNETEKLEILLQKNEEQLYQAHIENRRMKGALSAIAWHIPGTSPVSYQMINIARKGLIKPKIETGKIK